MNFLIRAVGCTLMCAYLFIENVEAQCPNGQPYQNVSYSNSMVGNGNQVTAIAQFDPSLGTLYSVTFTADIYFNFSYTLLNSSGSEQDYTVTVKRRDLLSATSPTNPSPQQLLPTAWFDINFEHDGLSGTGVPPGSSSYVRNIYNPKNVSRTFDQDVVTFMGSDSLYLKYTTITQDGGLGNSQVSVSQKTVYDSIIYNVTYNYCPAAVLPSKSININSALQSGNIIINWNSRENLTEGSYEILKSTDGKVYTSISKQSVNANALAGYSYLYKPTKQDPSKAFFRVKQIDKNGEVTYSKVITVKLPDNNDNSEVVTEKKLIVYPTIPSNFINVFIPDGDSKDEWNIKIISLSGRVMQQSKFSNTKLAKVTLANSLAAGMYIVDAYNTRTQVSHKDKIIIQR